MASKVARPQRQPVSKAIAVARGGYSGLRRTSRTRQSWECGQFNEDGTMVMNFNIERRGGALGKKREREERWWLELKNCSATWRARPSHLHGMALRLYNATCYSSKPLRPAAHRSSAPHRLSRAPPSVARLRAAHLPTATGTLRNSDYCPLTPPAHLKPVGLRRTRPWSAPLA